MLLRHLVPAAIFCLGIALPARAAMPLATDDTGTQGTAKFQLETALQADWDRQDNLKTTDQAVSATLTGGASETVDLVASYSYTWQTQRQGGMTTLDNSGFNDLYLAIKWRFLESGPLSLALKPAVKAPTASYSRGLGAGRPAYSALLVSTFDLKPVAVSANLGYTYQLYPVAASATGRKNLLNLSLAAAMTITPSLQLMAEVVASSNANSTSSVWPVFMTGGASFSIADPLDVDLGVRVGLTNTATDISLLTGCTVRF
jgi:hypothetical protein